MPLAQETAHIATGLMTLCGAAALAAFLMLRSNFGTRLRVSFALLAAGLLLIGVFQFTVALKLDGPALDFVSVAAIIGASIATVASVILAHIALESRLIKALHHRVDAHRRTLTRLRQSRAEIESRVKERSREVHEQEKRLRIALRDSNISVFMQGTDLRYVWMRNAHEGFNATELIGKCDDEILPPRAALAATTAKKKVMETGEDVTTEICIEPTSPGEKVRYFDVTTEPYYGEDGALQGLLSVSVETTETRHREELLKTTLLEVSHRTKNQLAVLISIARQLGATKHETAEFLPAFEARMRALSICQDVLVENDWGAPPLERLVRAQLEPYQSRVSGKKGELVIGGPEVRIAPTSVQNLGLVLHELALNAFAVGLMSSPAGKIDISWDLRDEDSSHCGRGNKTLEIRWNEQSAVTQLKDELDSHFGQTMAHKLARSALGGELELIRTDTGVLARLQIGNAAIAN